MPDSPFTRETPSAASDAAPALSPTRDTFSLTVQAEPSSVAGQMDTHLGSDTDPTGGLWSWSADLYGDLSQRLATLLDLGGPVVLVLAVLSIVALTISLLKLWQFAHLGIGRHGPVERSLALWCQRKPQEAMDALQGNRSPAGRLVHLAMTGVQNPELDDATLREELVRVASRQLETLGGYLRALEVIATLSPLLGLLGTVLGMIQAFQELAVAGSQVDPALLSGGIWQALLTTALGLAVAIPVMLVHSWLERRVERCGHAMEDAVTRVFTLGLTPVPPPTACTESAAPSTLAPGVSGG